MHQENQEVFKNFPHEECHKGFNGFACGSSH